MSTRSDMTAVVFLYLGRLKGKRLTCFLLSLELLNASAPGFGYRSCYVSFFPVRLK